MTSAFPSPALVLPVPLYLLMLFTYHFAAPHFRTEKQRAYVLSTCSSLVMSSLSVPFVWVYATQGLEGMFAAGQEGWMGRVGEFGVVFFGVYLFADLSLGYLRYPSQIGLLTGWVHHTVYIGLMLYCLQSRLSPIFLTGAIMELPTFDLAISNLFPRLRNDLRFLSCFFMIRIAYNAVFLADCLRPSSIAITDGSWVPSTMLFLAGALHVSWFRGGVLGYLKRRRAYGGKSVTQPAPPKTVGEPVVDAAATLDPSIPSTTLPSTPEDSPLVTPRTPSITPMSLRDSYLPTLAIPSLPLPKVAVPSLPYLSDLNITLPTRDINFGFKDAVKQHWGDRRTALEGIGLNLGGLGLRRRGRKDKEMRQETEVRVEEVSVES